MGEQKPHRVDFKDEAGGGFQYLALDAEEAKAWRKLDSVAKVTAEEPPSNEPATADLREVGEAREKADALDAGFDLSLRDMSGPEKEAAAKARQEAR
jgi:hypothetical protein